jgi:2-oxoisovalerate dehydrogenase E2 component (dihydrolipoyl transacylase)
MSELKQFKLPDVGEGLTEADIVRWLVQPGDKIDINQIIVEIETAKAVVELPSPYAGVVEDLLVPEGATADVGTPIISVQVGADGTAGATDTRAEAGDAEPHPAPKEERQAVLVGYGVKLGATKRRPKKAAAAGAGAALAPAEPRAAPAADSAQDARTGVLAKPPVRKLAKDLGIDLAMLKGTGPSGSVTRDDVQAAAQDQAKSLAAAAAPGIDGTGPEQVSAVRLASLPREERIAIRGVRKHTAAAMAASAFSAPHVTEFLQIDITETMAATARLRSLPEFGEVRVTPLVLVAKALLVAAARHPMINSSWDEAAQEIVVKHYVNLGIAAATDRGLIVPTVKDAHALSLPGLAQAIAALTETARAGKSTPSDLRGGTITITNVGVFGVDTGTPIITPGEAAILAFGQVKDAPWVVNGQLAVRKVCTLALSFDHRIVDGDLGSAVLRDVGAMLTDPLRMLAWS